MFCSRIDTVLHYTLLVITREINCSLIKLKKIYCCFSVLVLVLVLVLFVVIASSVIVVFQLGCRGRPVVAASFALLLVGLVSSTNRDRRSPDRNSQRHRLAIMAVPHVTRNSHLCCFCLLDGTATSPTLMLSQHNPDPTRATRDAFREYSIYLLSFFSFVMFNIFVRAIRNPP